MSAGRLVVYGGRGALGNALVEYFIARDYWVLSVDLKAHEKSHANVVVPQCSSWIEQEKTVLSLMQKVIGDNKVNAILCVAGGWAGGNAHSVNMIKNADTMWKQSVWSSSICARAATTYLRPGGFVQFTGSASVIDGAGSMIGYGMTKAAVHHLTKSMASAESGLPTGCSSLALLPVCLDTPANRKSMPKEAYNKWTPLESVAELLHKWISDPTSRPQSGSLVKLITKDGQTKTIII
uniref:Dihydropteridine reductase n=1 Tax=Syphacia muris TaxID=451379 RepID=A0A0N5ATS5_9BILA